MLQLKCDKARTSATIIPRTFCRAAQIDGVQWYGLYERGLASNAAVTATRRYEQPLTGFYLPLLIRARDPTTKNCSRMRGQRQVTP